MIGKVQKGKISMEYKQPFLKLYDLGSPRNDAPDTDHFGNTEYYLHPLKLGSRA